MKKNLLIVGGGYAGTTLINSLKNYFDITLIDEKLEHIEQTEIHRYIGEQIPLDELIVKYEEYAHKNYIRYINARVENIDFENKEVFYMKSRLSYDYIIIASGSKTFFPKQIKNLDKYKKDIKDINTIKNFKKDFDLLISKRVKNKNILIAGAGLSGVEIAIELAQRIKNNNLSSSDIRITLVEQQATILPGNNEFLINKTKEVLDTLDISCVHGEFITQVEDEKIILSNKEEIPYELSLFVLGVSSLAIENKQGLDINVKGQYIVNDYFQIENYNDAFCIGDAAQTMTLDGKYNLPTAQMANMQGKVLSQNLKLILEDKKMIKKELKLKGVLIDLGKNNAVGLLGNFKINGYIAYILKRFTSYIHKTRF